MESQKFEGRWYILVGDKRKCEKRKQECTMEGLGLLPRVAPVSVGGF